MKVYKNFDWSITEKKVVMFMPNYNGKELTEFSIRKLKTEIKSSDWVIIIGNDNVSDDFSHLASENVYYFTLIRDDDKPRNGAFIRNYIIKRCRSKLLIQKDGEVVIGGDIIKSAIKYGSVRAKTIYVLDENQTNKYMTTNLIDPSIRPIAEIELPNFSNRSSQEVAKELYDSDGVRSESTYFHYGFSSDTNDLKYVRGYDERFKFYGFEDSDMYCRLYQMKSFIVPVNNIIAIHLFHKSTLNYKGLRDMRKLFSRCDPRKIIRNPKRWGEGI